MEVLLPNGTERPHIVLTLIRYFVVMGLAWDGRDDDERQCKILFLRVEPLI